MVDFAERSWMDEESLNRWLAMPSDGHMLRHLRDTPYFEYCGGVLMEHVLLLGILDSFRAMREIPPLISTKDKTKYNTRKRWRWQAGKTNRETLEAREWVENELPKYWNCVFARSSSVVLAWARHVWSEIDRDPKAEETYRTMVSQALIPAAGNGKRNPDA